MAQDKDSAVVDGRLSKGQRLAALRVNAAHIVGRDINAATAVNDLVLAADKAVVRYKNGVTLPIGAQQLLADARRKSAKHSEILSNNMQAAGAQRPANVAAHHIVAHGDERAYRSQELLFSWCVAINDVDNGVYLPRHRKSLVPELPDAVKHSVLHTKLYHLEVYARLQPIEPGLAHTADGRAMLKRIKKELINNTFPYRPEGAA